MSTIKKIIIFILLLYLNILNAEDGYHKIILESNRDKNIITNKLIEVKNIFDENNNFNLDYKIEKFGNYYTITLSPIDTPYLQKSLFLLFLPSFPNLFTVYKTLPNKNTYQSSNQISNNTTLMMESLNKIEETDFKPYQKEFNTWLEKWYILIIIFILGLYFYYLKFRKIYEIKSMQNDFSKNQDNINF